MDWRGDLLLSAAEEFGIGVSQGEEGILFGFLGEVGWRKMIRLYCTSLICFAMRDYYYCIASVLDSRVAHSTNDIWNDGRYEHYRKDDYELGIECCSSTLPRDEQIYKHLYRNGKI